MASRLPPASRLAELTKLRSWVFDSAHNPGGARIGTKVLRQSLRGPLIKDYYYPSLKALPTPKQLTKMYMKDSEWAFVDPEEIRRLDRVEHLRKKGKGAPKKLKEKKVVEKKRK